MLVIRVELWPGGDRLSGREVARAGIANVSDLAAVSDYVAVLQDDRSDRPHAVVIRGHERAAGLWTLLARACAEGSPPRDDRLADVAAAIAWRLGLNEPGNTGSGPR